jgi:VCBS repeat-containing protein
MSNALNTPSLSNTPQAGDDYYTWTQDSILLNSNYNASTNVVALDVMSNDLGGNAKKLFSIDDGGGTFLTDLKTNNVNTGWEQTANGNSIRIYNGQIQFNFDHELFAATGSHDVKSLAAGQTITDSFVYTIQLGNGALSWATVNFSLTGTNDPITIGHHDDGAVKEDVGAVADNPNTPVMETGSFLATTGTITFADADSADHHSASVTADAGNTLGGTLTAAVTTDSTGGGNGTVTWSYAINDDAANVQALAEGQQVVEKFTVTIDDGNGGTIDQLITVTVTGTNDTPAIAVVDTDTDSAELTETDAALSSLANTLSVTDVDTNDTVTVSATHAAGIVSSGYDITAEGLSETALLAMFTTGPAGAINADTGDSQNASWSFDSAPQAFDFLQAGEDLTVTYTVAAQDSSSTATDTTTHDVTVTVHGTNDAAVFGGDEAGDTTEDGGVLQATGGTLTVSDADHDQSAFDHASTLTGSYGDFTFDTGSGDWTYTLRNGDANVQALAEGQQVTDTLTVTSTDGSTQNITVTVNGADEPVLNHAPVAIDDHWIISQNTTAALPIAALLGNDNDPDGNPLSVIALSTDGVTWKTDASDGIIDGVIHLMTGSLAVNTVSDTISYKEQPGATGDTTFYYRIDDGHGGTDSGQVTVTAQMVSSSGEQVDLSSKIYDYSYIDSGNGVDTVTGGGTAIDNFFGGSGSDGLIGSAGADIIDGQSGDDIITGGAGNDTLTGGTGNDHFVYNSTTEGLDTILDFGHVGDSLDFSAAAFGAGLAMGGANLGTLDSSHFESSATGTATNAAGTAEFVYNTTTGVLAFDPDGSGVSAAIQLAIVENGGSPVTLLNTDVHLV